MYFGAIDMDNDLNRLTYHFKDLKLIHFGDRGDQSEGCARYCCTVNGGREDSEFDVVQLLGLTLLGALRGFLREGTSQGREPPKTRSEDDV